MRHKSWFSAIGLAVFSLMLLAEAGTVSIAQVVVEPAPMQHGPLDHHSICKHCVRLVVEVSDKKGHPVNGLAASDFTVLDNNEPQKLLSFRAVNSQDAAPASLRVLIVIDAINADYQTVARERDGLADFLKQNDGKLPYPVSIAVLTDSGVKVEAGPTEDGKELLTALNNNRSEFRTIIRTQGVFGAGERLEDMLNHLGDLVTNEEHQPGRKLVLFLSRGWPMLAYSGRDIDTEHRAQLFHELQRLTNGLLNANITLYCLAPTEDELFLYQDFLKPVTRAYQAGYENVSLQVLAEHTGGLVLMDGNDIKGEINSSVQDAGSYYVMLYETPPAGEGTDYHAIRVNVDKPKVKVRTTAGYYLGSAQTAKAIP